MTTECTVAAETRQTHYNTSADGSVLVTLDRRPGQPEWRVQSVGAFIDAALVRHYMWTWEPIPDDLAPYVEHALSIARAEQ